MSALHQFIPFLKYRSVKTRTWASAGNSLVVTDDDVRGNSIIVIHHTSAYAGLWYISAIPDAGGSFTINSSAVEDGSPTFRYEIL